jgi:hypothetical protein
MSAEIVNLNRVRKARARADKERAAHENRLKFGASKADRARFSADKSKTGATLDGAKRDAPAAATGMSDDDSDPDGAS